MTPRLARLRVASPFVLRLASALAAVVLTTASASAQFAWTQPETGTASGWATTGPWTPTPPVSGTTTVIDFNVHAGRGAYTFTNDIATIPLVLQGMNLNNWSTSTLALDGTALSFSPAAPFINNNGPGNVNLSAPIILETGSAVGLVFGGSGNGTLTVSSVISGDGPVTINTTGLGIINFNAANTFTPGVGTGVTLTNGTLALSHAAALGAGGNILTINGGSLRFGNVTIANAITANADLVVAGGSTVGTLSGIISGSSGLQLRNYNALNAGLTLTAANTYTGATTVQSFIPNARESGPTLTLSDTNGAIASVNPITIGKNATLNIGTTGTNANRIADTAPIVVNNGTINYIPAGTGITETVGALTINGSMRLGTVATGNTNVLQFGALTRNNGGVSNAGVLWLTSNNFGNVAVPATNTRVFFTGETPVTMNFTAGAETQIGIVPWAVGGGLTAPTGFTNYDAVDGLRVIPITNVTLVTQVANPATLTAGIIGGTLTNKNINISAGENYVLGGSSLTVNAFSTSAGTVGITGGTLTVASGTVLNAGNTTFGVGAVLNFGAQRGYIHSAASTVFLDGSQITGSGGLVIAGMGLGTGSNIVNTTTFQNTGGNPFTGGLMLSGNVAVGFRQNNQLGDAAGTITFDGGLLAYNAAANLTISRDITLGAGNGGFSFNQTGVGATSGNADANTILTLSGIVGGSGAFIKEGIGTVNLTGANTYGGGTVVSAGTLQFTNDGNLGTAGTRIVLNGGTLQPLAAGPFARPVEVNASSTILVDTGVDATLASPFSTVSHLYTANQFPTLTKQGTGTLTLSAASPNFSGNVTVNNGTLALAGANGSLPQVSTFTVNSGATLAINNATNNANRINDLAAVTVNSGTFNYIAGAATGNPAEQMGVLTITGTVAIPGRVNIDATAAASSTILRFASLTPIASSNTVIFSGTDLGGSSGNFTRILFDTAPSMTLSGTILNATFSNTSNGASQGLAGYNATNGIVLVPTPDVSGNVIDNFAGTSVAAKFTTNALTTANTGAVVYQLILDAGNVNLVDGANGPSATNNFMPFGTLGIGNSIISQNGAKAITVTAGTTNPTIAFGVALADITTTSDLTIANGITLTGLAGAAKSGPGVLTLNGAYNVSGGPLAVNAGTLTFGSTSTALSTPAITLSNTGTTINFNGTAGASIGALTLNLNTAANLSQNLSATGLSGTGALSLANGNLTLAPSTAQTFNGTISGNGSLLYSPTTAALLTLGGNNFAFAGGITGNGNARLAITNANALGSGPVNVSAQNASSDFANPTLGFKLGDGSSTTLANNIVLSQTTGGLNLVFSAMDVPNQIIELAGAISSSGGSTNTLVWGAQGSINSNTLILSNSANSFVANVRVNFGTIAIGSDGALGVSSNQVTLANTGPTVEGSLRFDADAISLNRQINVNGNGASINTNEFNATISGLFTGTNTFSKIGAGTLTLSNAGNTFNGPVNVNVGTLLVDGNLPGATAGVATNVSGGTLAGRGTLGSTGALRSVNVSGGGTLAGGDPAANIGIDPGTLTVRGNATVNAGGNFQIRITTALVSSGTNGSSSGVGSDPLNNSFLVLTETGTAFTLNGNIVIDGTGLTFNPSQSYSYLVARLPTGAPAININDQSRFQTIGFVDTPENIALITDSGAVYLNFTPVPEPATVLGLAAGALGLGGYVRRRFRRV